MAFFSESESKGRGQCARHKFNSKFAWVRAASSVQANVQQTNPNFQSGNIILPLLHDIIMIYDILLLGVRKRAVHWLESQSWVPGRAVNVQMDGKRKEKKNYVGRGNSPYIN
eukprot:1149383-Pelagomonas_calceolata.AAC.3